MHHKSIVILLILFSLLNLVARNVMPVTAITWSTQINRLTDYSFFDAYPSITQLENGTIMITWAEDAMGKLSLFYSLSHDYGSTWLYRENLTAVYASGDDSNPSVTQLSNGTIFVVWASDRPPQPTPPKPDFYITASPQNLTIPQGNYQNTTITVTSLNDFNEPVSLMVIGAPSGVNTMFNPTEVTPPPNNNATSILTVSVEPAATIGTYTFSVMGKSGKITYIVDIYLEITESITYSGKESLSHSDAKKKPRNNRHTPDTKDARGHSHSSRSLSSSSVEAADEDATTHDYEIYYKLSHDHTVSWSNDTVLTDNEVEDVDPSTFQVANGTIYIFWSSNINGNYDIFYQASSDFGYSWSNRKQVTYDTNEDKGPSVIQTHDGNIWMAWCSNRYGDYEIMYKRYDGSAWSPDMRLTTSTNSDATPSIMQTLDKTMWIFWPSDELSPTSTGDIYYKISSDNGDTWSSQSIQFTTHTMEDTLPCVTQMDDTEIWVVWTSNRGDDPDGNWDIYYRSSIAGDLNEDGVVDDLDLAIVNQSFGYYYWEPEYDAVADINKDGFVGLQDVIIVAVHYDDT